MRVLLVTGLTHFGRAGVQRETERLITGLSVRGASVALLADAPPADAAARDVVTHHHLPFPPPAETEARITEVLSRHRADLLHVVGGGVKLLWAAHRAAGRTRTPWIITIHNVPPRESTVRWFQGHNRLHYGVRNVLKMPSRHLWHRFLRAGTFSRAVCHSAWIEAVARSAGCPPAKLVRIPLGCDASPGEPEPLSDSPDEAGAFAEGDAPRIVSVGGMAHHKGFHDYLRVVARLVRGHPRLRYVIMGDVRDRHYRRTLERLIERLDLTAHVRLIRLASEAQRLTTARQADLYVVPSHEEGFCLSYLEGAMLVPRMLGTRCGAIADMADGDGLQRVVEPGDLAALERATRELLRVDVAADALARRRAALYRRYDWQRYAARHEAMYHEVTNFNCVE